VGKACLCTGGRMSSCRGR